MRRAISRFLVPAVAVVGALGSGAWLVTQEIPAWASPIPWATLNAQNGPDRIGSGPGMMGAVGTGMTDGTGMGGNGTGMMGSAGTGMMGSAGTGMMGWVGGNAGPVADLDGAREQAAGFARFLGGDLRVGEVMRFSNHYYAQILNPEGSRVTEVLVDPGTGRVQVEFGPAMMWNSRYGMAAAASGTPEVAPEEARAAAERARGGDGTTVGPAEEFPGYYTLHTLKDGEVEGMVSVNAATGAVWSHGWHGSFVEMSEDG
ncbi:hypothetical protein [Cellulosimicrobium funkei]|uniref:hypothetical protein n=1 Tax=Cellulosimicrobium funkei TaxID=264251 RepID=UPI00343B068F